MKTRAAIALACIVSSCGTTRKSSPPCSRKERNPPLPKRPAGRRSTTPLHEAAASGGAELIHLLLEHKTDPSLKSKQGVTALDLAKQYKNQPAIDALTGR